MFVKFLIAAAAASTLARAVIPRDGSTSSSSPEEYTAVARIVPLANSTVQGTATFTQRADSANVTIAVSLTGVPPGTVHGFHIHAFGDASTPLTGLSMGGHFNPSNASHGCPAPGDAGQTTVLPPDANHFGDLGSVAADAAGAAARTWVSPRLSLRDAGSAGFVLGRGVVVHERPDDCASQPTGNAGARLAQGVVAISADLPVASLPQKSALSVIAVFASNGAVAIDHTANTVSLNLTGLLPSKEYSLESFYTGDSSKLKLADPNDTDCGDDFDGTEVVTFSADENGKVVQSLPLPEGIVTNQLLGRGFVLVSGENCPIAIAPIGAQFVAPAPVPTTVATGVTTAVTAASASTTSSPSSSSSVTANNLIGTSSLTAETIVASKTTYTTVQKPANLISSAVQHVVASLLLAFTLFLIV
ncbi:superoxide dismutase [Obelidium mucronatum]|nr:superoxide dismutase [Obelidium mucronatum]